MRLSIKTTVLLTLVLAHVGCATSQKPQRPPLVPERKPTVIGNVSLVNSKVGFVLIESRNIPPAGTVLKSLSPQETETATLKVTFERQPPFIIADIIKGSPYPGEPVIVAELPRTPRTPAPIIPTPPPSSGSPFPADAGGAPQTAPDGLPLP